KELGTACGKRHQIAGLQADGGHPLPGSSQAVTAKAAEQLLRAVGGKNDAGRDAQRQARQAVIGCKYTSEESGLLHDKPYKSFNTVEQCSQYKHQADRLVTELFEPNDQII